MKNNEENHKGSLLSTLGYLFLAIVIVALILFSWISTVKGCVQRRKDEQENEIESILDEYAEDYVLERHEDSIYAKSPEDFVYTYELEDVLSWYFDDTDSEDEWVRDRYGLNILGDEIIRQWIIDHYDLEEVMTWYEEAK